MPFFVIVSKILPEFVYPFNLAVLCFVLTWLQVRQQRLRRAKWLLVIGLILLLAPGMPIVADQLTGPLERSFPPVMAAEAPAAGAIVVLGGTTSQRRPPYLEAEENGGGRLLMGARLFKAGKASLIIVTGGGPYPTPQGTRTEADDMKEVLVAMGVPADAIVMESQSWNTNQNAQFTHQILTERQIDSILLVTSAAHQWRSVGLFRKLGLTVHPVPCAFRVIERDWDWRRLKPNPGALKHFTDAYREYLGYVVYKLAGKI